MSKSRKSVSVFDGEYYIDMARKPHKTIWQAAKVNNEKPLVVKRYNCKDPSVFIGL